MCVKPRPESPDFSHGEVQEISFSVAKNKKSLEQVELIQPNISRVQINCGHFHECGGCSMIGQHVDAQMQWKHSIIKQLFFEDLQAIQPMIQNPSPLRYRNKVEFTFSQNLQNEKKLGFIRFGARGFAFDLQDCLLIPNWMIEAKKITYELFLEYPIEAFYLPKNRGDLKNLVLRSNHDHSELLIALVIQDYTTVNQQFLNAWVEAITKRFVQTKTCSIYLIEQKVQKGIPTSQKLYHLKGQPSIFQKMSFTLLGNQFNLEFKISPLSFFQPNPYTAQILYTEVIKKLDPKNEDVILDLYCGSGTFGMVASQFVQKVIGIEINENAIQDGKELLQLNQISNMEFFHGDVKQEIHAFLKLKINKVIVDPPRAGLDPHVISALATLSPEMIIYVSCNPKTQIEDVKQFKNFNYAVFEITPVDQFTHTPHIENIVVLKKM